MTRTWIATGFALALMTVAIPAHAVDGGVFGDVTVLAPQGQPRGLVVQFSGGGGWNAEDAQAAQALAKAGALVVEVDTKIYLARVDGLIESCHWASGDAEQLSRRLQRERGWATYQTPIMAGSGEGATLAWITLAQAPPVTFAGAVSVDPTASIVSHRPFCGKVSAAATADGVSYAPSAKLPGVWAVGLTDSVPIAVRDQLASFQKNGGAVEVRTRSASADPGQQLTALVSPHLSAPASQVADLPLIELPVERPSPLMAVIISGEGGWRDIDKSIADYFHSQGVPVVGIDSLHYFWNRKTPDRTAADVASVVDHYMAKWQAGKVALIGYSFGADVMPFVYDRLSATERAHVDTMVLLGLSKAADFEIHVQGWLGRPASGDALPILPEIERVPPGIIQCVYGREELDSTCLALASTGAEIIDTPGGHHFGGDYEQLAKRILDGFKRRAE